MSSSCSSRDKLSPSAKKTILIIAGAVALLGPVVSIIGNLVIAVRALGIAMLFVAANPIVLIIAGLVAVGAAIVIAYQRSETFRRVVSAAIEFVRRHWQLLLLALGPFPAMIGQIIRHFGAFRSAGVSAFNAVIGPVRAVVGAIQSLIGWINTAIGAVNRLRSMSGGGISTEDRRKAIFGEPKAAGGPVAAGRVYLVGEHRPELFVPNTSGRIIPRVATAGGGGTTIVVQNHGVIAGEREFIAWLRKLDNNYALSNGGQGFLGN